MNSNVIPVNSLVRHIAPLRGQLAAAADDVIRSGFFVLGPDVTRFEQLFADYCGAAYCIGVGNGTDALELSLKAVGIGHGDHVAVVANAAMYGTSAVLACGATPVFIDIEPLTATMAPAALASALESTGPIKAVIVTHLYGKLARIEEIVAICQPAGIPIIEDCAQAHGAMTPDGRRAGTLGDVGCFSFYPTKNLGALGDGGAVTTSDASVADRVRQLRQYGWTQKYTNGLKGGRNSRLDELQARMLTVMLPLLDGWNERRRVIANRYSSHIRNKAIEVQPIQGTDYVAHLYVVRCRQRDALRAHLLSAGIQTDVHYPLPDHRQPCLKPDYAERSLPVTESDADTVLSLPCFPELTDDELRHVVDACNRF